MLQLHAVLASGAGQAWGCESQLRNLMASLFMFCLAVQLGDVVNVVLVRSRGISGASRDFVSLPP